MTEREYQLAACTGLRTIYEVVESQWRPFLRHGHQMYSPAIDIAVGPFATERRFGDRYLELLNQSREFIEQVIAAHNQNVEVREERTSFDAIAYFNENARCFLSIEIENTGSRKHCIGIKTGRTVGGMERRRAEDVFASAGVSQILGGCREKYVQNRQCTCVNHGTVQRLLRNAPVAETRQKTPRGLPQGVLEFTRPRPACCH